MSEINKFKKEVRSLIADYMRAEGCSCCRDYDTHAIAKTKLGKLLGVKKYSDNSGYDFDSYRTQPPAQKKVSR